MNKTDEFYYWTSMAISEPYGSLRNFYYNLELDRLFALNVNNGKHIPVFRNKLTQNRKLVRTIMDEEVEKLMQCSANIILLPRLAPNEKKAFFKGFALSISDEFILIRQELLNEIAFFGETDSFAFKTNIKEKNPLLYYEYELQKGSFLIESVRKKFGPFGVSENTVVIW